MPRTLRMQVLAIAMLSIAIVLGISDWLAAKLSEDALRADVVDRVRTAIERIVGADPAPEPLRRLLQTIVLDNRDLASLRVYARVGQDWELIASSGQDPAETPRPDLRPSVESSETIALPNGTPGTRTRNRLTLAGGFEAVVEADASLEAWEHLRRQLRLFDLAFFLGSITVLGFALDTFFRRRVEPRVARLARVVSRAAEGHFDEPVEPVGAAELDELVSSLNAMLQRVEQLTRHLEERVDETTEELRDLQAQAVRSERFAALGQTVATLAHELGTPLNSVLGYAQLLRQDAASPDQAAKLEIIESQIRRMIDAIRRMLDHTRRGVVEREDVDIARLIDEVQTLVRPRADEQHVELSTKIADGLDLAEVDPNAVRQIMVNLINNAMDAQGTTSVEVRVQSAEPSLGVEIEVSDDGSGISKEDQDKIFKPFFTTKDAGRGTGLGLAIVDHLVQAHAGQILVESTLGKGTTFRVHLPGRST